MKRNRILLIAAFAMMIFGGHVTAQELQQPVLNPITYTLDDDTAASPSDGDTWSFFKRDGEGLEITGWTQFGYHDRSTGLFNNNPKKVTVHQVWVEFDKASDADAEGFGLGYHFDLMYGADASDTSAFGNPDTSTVPDGEADGWDNEMADDGNGFGWAMPQLYVEGHLGDWTITAGKFFSPAGYEVVQAPGNFFYSHARTMKNSEARTHTGILASKTTAGGMDLTLGWTAGWDTGFDQNGSNGILGLSKSVGDNTSVSYVTSFGDISDTENGYTHSIVVDITLGERLSYVLQTDYVKTTGTDARYQIGVNQYAFYTISEKIAAGVRLEWWREGNSVGTGSEYSFTAGFNYRPNSRFNMLLRPEMRVDWNETTADTQTIFGIDAIVNY